MILKHYNTNFVHIPPRTETRLVVENKNAVDWHTRPIATRFQLSLFADEGLEFSLCRFNLWPPNPAKFKQPIQKLSKEVKSWKIITSNDDAQLENARQL